MQHKTRLLLVMTCISVLVITIYIERLAVQAIRQNCIASVLTGGKERIVFDESQSSGSSSIYLATADKTLVCLIFEESEGVASLTISPNGNYIVFVSETYIGDAPPGPFDIYMMNIDGSNRKRLTNGGRLEVYKDPVWSPDSKQIVFTHNVTADETIYVMSIDSLDMHWLGLTGLRTVNPTWTTDGQQIIFKVLYYQYPYVEWYIMNADGSNPHPLELF